MKIITKADIGLIVVILILSVVSIFSIPRLLTSPGNGKMIMVHLNNEVIHQFPLVESDESEFIDFPFTVDGKEYTGRLEMKDGYVRLHRLPKDIVPLAIHADMGWIREPYQMIVSLPIRMYITVENTEEEEQLFDIIVH
ncbi:MAG: NusG domain II-containing protein [Clostridiaceae bacterium]|nr:NusG domain II-containing protein [Clostridiaceae bacterium]